MGTTTSVSNSLEISEDEVDLWSLLRFLMPALLGDLPDCRSHSWGIKTTRFWWPFALRDHNGDVGIREFREGHLSGRELGTKRSEPGQIILSESRRTSTMTIEKE